MHSPLYRSRLSSESASHGINRLSTSSSHVLFEVCENEIREKRSAQDPADFHCRRCQMVRSFATHHLLLGRMSRNSSHQDRKAMAIPRGGTENVARQCPGSSQAWKAFGVRSTCRDRRV